MELCEGRDSSLRARFQLCQASHKKHVAMLQFDEQNQQPITGWYYTCFPGSCETGMRSHITPLVWYLGVARVVALTTTHLLSAFKLLTAIDNSMKFSVFEGDSDNDVDPFFNINTKVNSNNDEDSK